MKGRAARRASGCQSDGLACHRAACVPCNEPWRKETAAFARAHRDSLATFKGKWRRHMLARVGYSVRATMPAPLSLAAWKSAHRASMVNTRSATARGSDLADWMMAVERWNALLDVETTPAALCVAIAARTEGAMPADAWLDCA